VGQGLQTRLHYSDNSGRPVWQKRTIVVKNNVWRVGFGIFALDNQLFMKIRLITVTLLLMCFACGPKPAYKTAEGKRKQKYYNNLQFGGDPQAVPPPKAKKRN
jgi:hypothetical protein